MLLLFLLVALYFALDLAPFFIFLPVLLSSFFLLFLLFFSHHHAGFPYLWAPTDIWVKVTLQAGRKNTQLQCVPIGTSF